MGATVGEICAVPVRVACGFAAAVLCAFFLGAAAQDGADHGQCDDKNCFGIDWSKVGLQDVVRLGPDLTDAKGRSPAYYAARNCAAPGVLYALADRGVDMNAADPATGAVPLAIAALVCPRSTVEGLLFLGADPDVQIPKFGSLLHLAVKRGMDARIVGALVDHNADLEGEDGDGRTPLHAAFLRDRRDIILILLKAGARTDFLIKGTPVGHFAVRNGDRELLEALVRAGTDLNMRDANGRTAIFYAIDGGIDSELGSIFSLAGADAEVHDNSGRGVLHYAAASADSGTLAVLIALGADPGDRDSKGDTPLHYALRAGAGAEVVTALLRMGADPDIADSNGNVPVLIAAGSLVGGNVLGELASAGADLEVEDQHGRSLLHIVAQNNNVETLARLLEAGADYQAANRSGQTPLHIAVLNRNAEIASALLQAGADPLAEDALRQSPLSLAVVIGIDEPAKTLFARVAALEREKMRIAADQKKATQDKLHAERAKQLEAQKLRKQEKDLRKAKAVNPAVYRNRIAQHIRKINTLRKQLHRAVEGGLDKKAERLKAKIDKQAKQIKKFRKDLAAAWASKRK